MACHLCGNYLLCYSVVIQDYEVVNEQTIDVIYIEFNFEVIIHKEGSSQELYIDSETKWPTFYRWHFQCIFLNENVWVLNTIWLKFVLKGSIDNNTALVQIMACRQPGGKPLSEPMMFSLLTHICITQLQRVNSLWPFLHPAPMATNIDAPVKKMQTFSFKKMYLKMLHAKWQPFFCSRPMVLT